MNIMDSINECAEHIYALEQRVRTLERMLYVLIGLGVGTGVLSVWEVLM